MIQNKVISNPDLKSLLDLFKTNILLGLNCHAIAKVQSFDSTAQTVQASIAYKKTFSIGPIPTVEEYPILIDCPVIVLQGGGFSLTFPIAPGDECLILFNDRDLDQWFSTGQVGPVPTQRLHSFSDGIALVGLNSVLTKIVSYDTSHALLRDKPGTTMVGLSNTGLVKIANPTGSLKGVINGSIDLLDNLETVLQAFATALVADAAAGAALNTAIATVLKPAIAAYKTAVVGGLLE